MFLLFLMSLGAANIKAQVRIGGSGAPNAAAVLDLNVDDSDTGNKGALALPRVSLANATAPLNGTTPLNGMLVYNIGGTLGAGVYSWAHGRWVLLTPADSVVTWTLVLDTAVTVPSITGVSMGRLAAPGVKYGDMCIHRFTGGTLWAAESNTLFWSNTTYGTYTNLVFPIKCYRPSM